MIRFRARSCDSQPHPQGEPRQARGHHRERVRRGGRRRWAGGGDQGGDLRDEQRLHLLHRPRRPHPHPRQAHEPTGAIRRHRDRDDGARGPGAGGADLFRGRRAQGTALPGRHPHRRGRQTSRIAPRRGQTRRRRERVRRANRVCGQDPPEQSRPGDARGEDGAREQDSRHKLQSRRHRVRRRAGRRRASAGNPSLRPRRRVRL
mmetsp:Transcript_8713/g.39551  ORF Transcript_8713/g.39551 Transcript_8713/m.39551 type:complete len:204 (-) Transcript_8713:1862-2473(-)